jgi:hypothetical protein
MHGGLVAYHTIPGGKMARAAYNLADISFNNIYLINI